MSQTLTRIERKENFDMKNCNNRYILLIGMCVVFFDFSKFTVVISEDATSNDLDRIYGNELYRYFEQRMSDSFCFLRGIDYQSLVTL